MAAQPPPTKKQRRPNFSENEVSTLIDGVIAKASVILGPLDSTVTAKAKQLSWLEVTSEVNAVACVPRDVDEVKRKFKDLRTQLKKKAAENIRHMQGTGGGPAKEVKYSSAEEKLLSLLSPTGYAGMPLTDSEGAEISFCDPLGEPIPSTSSVNQPPSIVLIPVEKVESPLPNYSEEGSSEVPCGVSQPMTSPASSHEPGTRSRSTSRGPTPAGLGPDSLLVPQFLRVQEEIRDLITHLVRGVDNIASAVTRIADNNNEQDPLI